MLLSQSQNLIPIQYFSIFFPLKKRLYTILYFSSRNGKMKRNPKYSPKYKSQNRADYKYKITIVSY